MAAVRIARWLQPAFLLADGVGTRGYNTKGMDIVRQIAAETTLPVSMGYQDRAVQEENGIHMVMKDWKGNNKKVLNFGSSDYLGLSKYPEIKEALRKGVEKWGNSPGGTRVATGTKQSHHDLEKTLAKFHNLDDSLYYSSTTMASAGFFQTIFDKRDALISDSLNHSSLVQAMRHCKAQKYVYDNLNYEALEKKLQEAKNARARCIVTDGIFSLDGHIVKLDEVMRLAEQYDAIVVLDDSHGTGVLGETGKGTDELCGVYGHPLLVIVTACGKGMGSPCGGYIAGPSEIIAKMRQLSRTFLFSNPNQAFQAEATNMAFQIHMRDHAKLLPKLRHIQKYFVETMRAKGFALMGSEDCCVKPILVAGKSDSLAMQMTEELMDEGYFATGVYFPAVPKNTARIRTCVNRDMTEDMIDEYAEVMYKLAVKHNLDFNLNKNLVESM